jgi:hypothetical protein
MLKPMFVAVLAVASLSVAPGCRGGESSDNAVEVADSEAAEIIESTPWLDKAPEAPEDNFSAYVFQQEVGVFVSGSQYRGSYDLFTYQISDKAVAFKFLADGKGAKSKFKLERVSKGPFDLRLTLKDSPRGPKVYYGFDHQHGRELPTELKHAVDHLGNYVAAAVTAQKQH